MAIHKIISKTPIPEKTAGVNSVKAEIDGVQYNDITPKIILNENIFGELRGDIKYKTKEAIYPGINVIDIDWNGALIDDKELHTTSDLISLLTDIKNNSDNVEDLNNYWEDVLILDPTYKLYFLDANEDKLENYTPISYVYTLVKENIAPRNAKYIGVFDSNDNKLYSLPLNNQYTALQHDFSEPLYSVGLMSDVHHDDICEGSNHMYIDGGNNYRPYEDVEHILSHYNNAGIEFVACAGDVSTDNIEHVRALHDQIKTYLYNFDFYTCKGNHDNAACRHYDEHDLPNASNTNNNELWKTYTIPGYNDPEYKRHKNLSDIVFFTSGDKTSFYFKRGTDVYIFFNVDYNSANSTQAKPLNNGDHGAVQGYTFEKTGINIPNLEQSTRCYHPDTIEELHSILDENRNNRCFVFTHQPFVNKTGDVNYCYIQDHNKTYMLNGLQFAILNEINNYYKNSIWFSGHTHYQWKWQKLSNRLNVCNWDCLNDNYNYNDYNDYGKNIYNKYSEVYDDKYIKSAYNVHIPSTSRPLRPWKQYAGLTYGQLIADPGAEGAIMDVYDDGVNIRGIQFADENTPVNEYIDYSNAKYSPVSDIFVDTTKKIYQINPDYNEQTVKDLGNGKFEFVFGPGVIDNNGNLQIQQRFCIKTFVNNKVHIENLKVVDANGVDITERLLNENDPQVGFFGNDYIYHLRDYTNVKVANAENSDPASVDGNFLEFNLSSTYLNNSENNLPITITANIYTMLYADNVCDIQYEDVYVGEANYWLPVPEHPTENIEHREYNDIIQYVQKFNR